MIAISVTFLPHNGPCQLGSSTKVFSLMSQNIVEVMRCLIGSGGQGGVQGEACDVGAAIDIAVGEVVEDSESET